MIEFGHGTHRGLRHSHNEDTYWADDALGLFLVADGMGGPGRGETASAITRDALVQAVRDGSDPAAALRDASARVTAAAPPLSGDPPTGASVALLRIVGASFAAVRIGDARIYLWHGGLRALPDPAFGNSAGDPVDTPRPRRHRMSQALGITAHADLCVEPSRGLLERGMQFLLCSNGLAEALDERAIATLLASTELAAQECVDHLLLAALDAGGRDNATAVLVRVT